MSPTRDRVGSEIDDGRYAVAARIGDGSMGQVYRAYDRHLETDVVLKFPGGLGGDDAYLERFAREARALIRLSHPHVVKVIDAGQDDGMPYLVMPFLEGGSLKDRIEAAGPDGEAGPLAPETLHGWLMDVAQALDFLHAQGHIHRDVKPANILFDRHGNVFLGDFGVIKMVGSEDEAWRGRSAMTAPGFLLGTPNYVAPELVMGQQADGRADQYSLALAVHESLAGWNFMEGPTPSATMVNQTKVEPPELGELVQDVPPGLSESVLQGLSKDPADRFATCSDLARAVLLDVPAPVPGRPPSAPVLITPASKGEPGRVPCPACGGLLPVVAEHAGMRVTCTRCRAMAVVQVASGTLQLRLIPPPKGTKSSETPVLYGPEPTTVGPERSAGYRAAVVATCAVGLAVAIWLGWRSATGPVVAVVPPVEATVTINVAFGTEKTKWLEGALAAFRSTPQGRRVVVKLLPMGSVQGADAVLNGSNDRPVHVWSPASSAYRDVFERDWRARHPDSPRPILKAENLVLTPMVFVFWKERHEAFLKKYRQVNFRTLSQAMHEPEGWAGIANRPDWGLFRFAHTDPSKSNSGMMTLVLMAYEFADKGRGLTREDIQRPDFQDWFARFEHGVSHHGPRLAESTGTLMDEMVRRGPSEYDCLVLYENLAVDSMTAARGLWGDLQIVYPEPNVWTDHPYYVLDVPWSSPDQRDAADQFLRFLMSEPIQRQALAHGFRPGNLAVSPRSPESPLPGMEPAGVRFDVPPMAEAPRADVVSELLSTFQRVEP